MDTLRTAQRKARNGEKLNREETKALRIEADRLQDAALRAAGIKA
jgi:hypothetical protein